MNKTFLITAGLISVLTLSACGQSNETSKQSEESKAETEQSSSNENAAIEVEAKEYDYLDLATEKIEKGTPVIISGEITYADEENNGAIAQGTTYTVIPDEMGEEVYWVTNTADNDLNLNDIVTIEGIYQGVDTDTGIPLIDGDSPTITEALTTENDEDAEEHFDETGEYYQEGVGLMKTVGVGYNEEIGLDGSDDPIDSIEIGPMQLSINTLMIIDVEPEDEDISFFFDDQEKVRAVVVDMIAENTSDEDVTFHPNQATLVTSTGEQLESEMFLMGDAGGDFYGNVVKEGQTWWLITDTEATIDSIKMIISPPHSTENWDDLAEEVRLDFEIISWEDAKERDNN
ncbi:hypothetical protein [Shouchella clausii]|uniref:hypothetical protein n=1 Tax=Shouchella clausii TaxID=79880 RepID=UPI000BA6103A|nr:hypothetical protein [Shouchella clausii]PAE96677.1 hypothetical protein CHH71_12400 [Shouchella clausii]